jgi:phytanoyl-CoA hydroxylase
MVFKMTTASASILSKEQLECYEKNGYMVVKIFDDNDFDPVREVITKWIDKKCEELAAEGKKINPHKNQPFENRAAFLLKETAGFFAKFDVDTILGPELLNHFKHPKMISVVKELLGESISLNPIHHIRVKPPALSDTENNGYFNVPWHQDCGVYTEDTDNTTILTCWRPIGFATEKMGCMQILPGVSGPTPLPHVSSSYGTMIDPKHMPEITPLPVPCKTGEVVIMKQFIPHMSTKNEGDICRWSIDVRYQVTGQPTGRDWQPETIMNGPNETSLEEWENSWKECRANGNVRTKHRVTN